MSKTDNDMIPRIALGLAIFVAMRFAPKVDRVVEQEKGGSTPYPSLKSF